jgi:hypothetical protein
MAEFGAGLGIDDVNGVPLKIGTPIKFEIEDVGCYYGYIKSLIYEAEGHHVFDMDSSAGSNGRFYKSINISWHDWVRAYQLTVISEEEYVQGIMES